MKNILATTVSIIALAGCATAGTVDTAQRMLNQLGYNAGAVDGAYGKKTRGALEAFYADNGGSFDGKLDANEIADLQAAMSERNIRISPLSNTEVEYAFGWDTNSHLETTDAAYGKLVSATWFHRRYVSGDYNNDGLTDYIVVGIPKHYKVASRAHDFVHNNGSSIKVKDGLKGTPYVLWGDKGKQLKMDMTKPFKRTDNSSGVLIPSITQADYNGDGHADIFVGNTSWDWSGAPAVLYLGNGDGTWTDVSATNLKNNDRQFMHQVESGDIDGDGDIDIVATTSGYSLECWVNNGSGVFKPRKCTNTRQETVAFSMADFDGDGDLDIYSAAEQEYEHNRKKGHDSRPSTHANRILVNNGRGTFSSGHKFPRRENCWDVNPYSEAFDIDGDGDYDIVNSITKTRYMLNGIEIIENLGNGKWSTKQFQITKETDFNSYIQKQWTIDQNCVAYKNGKFSGHDETSPMNFHYQFIHFGDVDNDGDVDISVSTADTFQWDEDYLYDKIQTRILTNTDNTIDGFILEKYKRAKFIK
jgi:hypothetical protein